MPARLKLDAHRCLEISFAKLSPRYGCGLMLVNLPRFDSPDPLVNALNNYGYTTLAADKPAKKHLDNSGLLKPFYDNTFTHKVPIRQNFRQTFGHLDIFMAHDPGSKQAWFMADPQNRMALANYYRDATGLGLKTSAILLLGSTIRLTPVGWQNLYDLLTDKFLNAHRDMQRAEIMTVLGGVRWRGGCLGLGVTLLNFRELAEIQEMVEKAFRGETGTEIQN